ncbi:MAG: LysE family transporter [Acidimicrobiales bacterium]
MVDPHRLLALALTAFALIVVPGPSVLFVISRGLVHGRRAGLATVLGNASGLAVQVVAVALGLGAVVASSVTAPPLQLLVLGALCVAIALVSDSAWAVTAGSARAWLARRPERLATMGGVGGVVTVGLGLRLLLTGRSD